jgi:hypothetical protein
MIHRSVASLLLLALLVACTPAAAAMPADFALAYVWREGSLPPPYHYSYQITLNADGTGAIAFTPDYAGPAVPTWEELFQLSAADLETFYQGLVDAGLLRERWRADSDPPVGGSSAIVQATANRRAITIPGFVVERQQAQAAAIHALIEAQVPAPIWTKLRAQHEAYMAEAEG